MSARPGWEILRPDSVTLVNRQCSTVAADEYGTAARGGRGNQRVVCSAAGHAVIRQRENEGLVRLRTQAKKRLRKARLQEFADDGPGSAMWRGQTGKDGVGFERAMLYQTQPAVERTSCTLVVLVPGSESGDHQARVGRLQRRTRSNVSRTSSAVSAGNSPPGIATTPLPFFFSCIGVEAISISRRPSPARISSG